MQKTTTINPTGLSHNVREVFRFFMRNSEGMSEGLKAKIPYCLFRGNLVLKNTI